MENLHLGVKLGVALCFIVFIGLKGITLLHKEIKVCKAGSIISEGDVVMLPTFKFNWCWTPQVTVYLSSKDLGMLALLLLQNQLPCGFNIDTKLAEERFPRWHHFQMHACQYSIINKLLH